MDVEQIKALIKRYISEYTDAVHQHYLAASTSATVEDYNFRKWQADVSTGQVAALSRLQYAIDHPDVEV